MPGYKVSQKIFKDKKLYDKYKCLACKLLLKAAVQSAHCGHWFCETCIILLLKIR